MGITPQSDPDLQQIIQALNRRITALEQSNALQGGVVISGGGLTAIDPNSGHTVFMEKLVALIDGSGRMQMALNLRRNDGTLALSLEDLGVTFGHTFQQSFNIWDINGDYIFADDIASGQGLARPYIPFGNFADNTVPNTTTSGTFSNVQTIVGRKQHPKLEGQILVYADAGTTGVVQLIDPSSNVLFTHNVTSGEFDYQSFGPIALAGTHLQQLTLSLQAKVSTGAGKVGARGTYLEGVQS